jgi:uncharacterized membrane protein (TIGR02234 family)
MTGSAPTARPGNRLMWTIVGLLALAALLLWGSSRFTWSWSITRSALRGNVVDQANGGTAVPALAPLALLALAAVAALVAIGGWLRRIVGVLLLAAGAAAVWLGISGLGGVFGAQPVGYPRSQILVAHGFALLGGVVLVGAAVLVLRYAARLPRLGAKYEAPPGAGDRARAGGRRAANPDAELWQALSEGKDPTQD